MICKRIAIRSLIGLAVLLVLFDSLSNTNILSKLLVPVIGDSMDWRSGWMAGLHGIDCGRVRVFGDPRTATACALKAQAEGKPFRVRYDIPGVDCAFAQGIVRTREGGLYALSYVGDPMGGGISLLRQKADFSPCPQPQHLWVNPEGRINCSQ
jgi:hypothetical protein